MTPGWYPACPLGNREFWQSAAAVVQASAHLHPAGDERRPDERGQNHVAQAVEPAEGLPRHDSEHQRHDEQAEPGEHHAARHAPAQAIAVRYCLRTRNSSALVTYSFAPSPFGTKVIRKMTQAWLVTRTWKP